jgi:integrase
MLLKLFFFEIQRFMLPLMTASLVLGLNGMERMGADLVKTCAARGLVPATTTAHSLRHTFATRYLAAHPHDYVGLARLLGHESLEARLLGHESLEATKIYIQSTDDELAERVERLDLNAYAG